MTDYRFTELLGKQLAGEISPEESDELKLIIADNEPLRKEYKALTGYFEVPENDDENINLVFDRIKSQITIPSESEKPLKVRPSLTTWLRAAAVLAVIVSVFAIYNVYFKDPAPNPLLTWKLVKTPAAVTKDITLSDGTIVNLNAATQLKYPEHFKGNTREVYLSGEAFFDVKKDPKHPFIVHTNKIQVKVLGTAFDVKAYNDDPFTETTLIRGRVEVSIKNNNAAPVILQPNEKFTLSDDTAAPKLGKLTYFTSDANDIIETSWMHHELMFKNNDFASIAKLFERWYDVKIVFKNDKLKNFKFTGQYNKERLTEALDALKLIEHFNYSLQGKIVYIYN